MQLTARTVPWLSTVACIMIVPNKFIHRVTLFTEQVVVAANAVAGKFFSVLVLKSMPPFSPTAMFGDFILSFDGYTAPPRPAALGS